MSTALVKRSRFVPQPSARLRLGPRDEKLLVDLFLHQAMTRGQIQQLWFQSVARCNARLRQLFDGGYLRRHFPASGPYGAQAIYTLGPAAAPLVAAQLGLSLPEVRKHCRAPSLQFLEHTLAVVGVYLGLRATLEGQADLALERWLPERLCRHEYDIRELPSGRWRHEAFAPDAFFRLSLHGRAEGLSFFVEVDRGHTAAGQFRGKLHHYQRYQESGLFAERYGSGQFRVLYLTTSKERLVNLCRLAEAGPGCVFLFTTFTAVESAGWLAPVWRTPASRDRIGLLDAAGMGSHRQSAAIYRRPV